MTELPRDDGWMCGAFEHVPHPYQPYRCTEPYGHSGPHRAVIDEETVAEWPRPNRRLPGKGPSRDVA